MAFVTGMQGDDPRYYRTISTPKHFAVHSGPEPTRHSMDVEVSEHDELDTYLPAFRATVTEAKAGSVMCAYNSINGQPACVNEFLLQDRLRGKWAFQGYVVSDCGAVIDIFKGHHFTASQPEASALALKRGMDNECVDFFAKVTDNHDYAPYLEAVKEGLLKESDIEVAVTRLMTARIKLGMFDPPELVPYTKISESELNSPAHRTLARQLANESMVLLKNDGVLPLKPDIKRIALIGPLADQTRVLLGNYNGIPTQSVSVLDGLKAEFPAARITFVPGTQFLRNKGGPIPTGWLTTDGKPGVRAEYSTGDLMAKPTPLAARVEANIDLSAQTLPPEAMDKSPIGVRWTATLTPTETGDYKLGLQGSGFARISLDDKEILSALMRGGVEGWLGKVHLEKGKSYGLKVEHGQIGSGPPVARLIWAPYDLAPSPEAVAAAKDADVVVAVVGITSELEGEEMPVNEEGFKGGDRTSLDLPKPEEELLQAVSAAAKPLVVVLMNGSALGVTWANEHATAILEAWYSGEEGGAAVAETLSGKNNPAGRLPVTFYNDVSQLPPFESYSMKGRTYRYFLGAPLYPFGYGLSYSTFAYSGLTLPKAVQAGQPLPVDVTVTNNGSRAGDQVTELYLSFPDVKGAPIRALRAFERTHLEAGASQKLHFDLGPRDLSMVTEAGDPVIAQGEYTVSVGGGQPNTGVAVVTQTFSVNGQLKLPE